MIVCSTNSPNFCLATQSSTVIQAGLQAEAVEAVAFAWFAKLRIEGISLDLTAITGSKQPNVLGAVYHA
jgi:1,6-anhydro-N-acetylmuramate kinase